ncbi:stationary phase survival protein SurE [Caldimicrobium thiodismutans]|uniref:5'-nucleotidase SurE n=1 Tax=Caldimicrobium thiodismutans TaxID=1653476 RepID=A0A0U4W3D6_9BACT|nr:5'/3'-nucleotidase SurE [Caldimicrobium thiodismutans]BAU23597.1 stationary phase survival protein SurE [Caldimicrobium thiodismutans]
MKILLTNDDGIYADGLCGLYFTLSEEHEVYIVAPEVERSAVGHAITIHYPLRVREVRRGKYFWGYAVSGTPADCVKLAIYELIGPVDLVISGINRGANVGINVLYSGTVSAATEAKILGYNGIAVSIDAYENIDYCFTAYFLGKLVKKLNNLSLLRPFCLNVNIPHLNPHQIKGVKFVRQSTAKLREFFEKRLDLHGKIYYWQGAEEHTETDEETDVVALKQGFITITPIQYDLTSYSGLTSLNSQKISIDI